MQQMKAHRHGRTLGGGWSGPRTCRLAWIGAALLVMPSLSTRAQPVPGGETLEQRVETALGRAAGYLAGEQDGDTFRAGRVLDRSRGGRSLILGYTSLGALARLAAGNSEGPEFLAAQLRRLGTGLRPVPARALGPRRLWRFHVPPVPGDRGRSAQLPQRDMSRLTRGAGLLCRCQMRSGLWAYGSERSASPVGDISNTQFALMALRAASVRGCRFPRVSGGGRCRASGDARWWSTRPPTATRSGSGTTCPLEVRPVESSVRGQRLACWGSYCARPPFERRGVSRRQPSKRTWNVGCVGSGTATPPSTTPLWKGSRMVEPISRQLSTIIWSARVYRGRLHAPRVESVGYQRVVRGRCPASPGQSGGRWTCRPAATGDYGVSMEPGSSAKPSPELRRFRDTCLAILFLRRQSMAWERQ